MTNITGREPSLGGLPTNDKGKRRLSLRRLGTMLNMLSPSAVSLDATREMLQSDDFFVRYNAAKLLSKRGDRDARKLMESALHTGNARTRASVARHLYGLTWFSAESLIRLALKDEDPRVREAAIYTLCDLKELAAYKLMETALKGEVDSVLEAAAFGLRETSDPAALPVLEIVLDAEDAEVRIKALEALGMCGLPQAMPIVREAMNDREPDVKYSATLSLLELAGEGWLSELAGVIGRTTGNTLEQVLKAFFHATNYLKIDVANSDSADLMIDALETALLDESVAVRKAATWPLAWLRHERTPKILLKTYRLETEPEVKAHIVRIGAGLMSEVSEQILADAINSTQEEVHEAAAKIYAERERTGTVAQYKADAYEGMAMNASLLGSGKLSNRSERATPPSHRTKERN